MQILLENTTIWDEPVYELLLAFQLNYEYKPGWMQDLNVQGVLLSHLYLPRY
jgi:hypothetical protein